jgi:copper chaperone CopZ
MSKASIYFSLNDLSGKRDVADIKQRIDKIPGVISVSVNRLDDKVAVDFDTSGTNQDKIREELTDLGFSITGEHFENHIM